MKKFILIIFILSVPGLSIAQKQGNIWYFGTLAGLDFNGGSPVALTNGQLITTEGSAVMSDANGNLMFYTEGVNVYNRNHVLMPNGTGLLGGTSASQSAIILPMPGVNSKYYIFTVPNTAGGGLRYSVVDMALAGGNGDIIMKNTLLLGTNVAEKLTATYHYNGQEFWVAVHDNGGNTFYAFQVGTSGITGPVISTVGTVHGGTNPWTGCMKFSPNGNKMAVCLYGTQQADLLDFDNATGIFSNPATYNFPSTFYTYGVDFSESGNTLYICNVDFTPGQIYQFNMLAGNNAAILATGQIIYNNPNDFLGSMQLGPDGKVYFVRYGYAFAGAIEFPDITGPGCSPNDVSVSLATGSAQLGLPDFFSGIYRQPVIYSGTCFGDTTFFQLADTSSLDSVNWNFRDLASGIYNTSTQFNPYHVFTNPGNYLVQLISTYLNAAVDTAIIPVHIYANVTVSLGNDTTICSGANITWDAFSAAATDYLWQDGTTASSYTAGTSGLYFVTVSNDGCTASDSINLNVIPCSTVLAQFQSADSLICPGTCTDFVNLSVNATTFQWLFPGANPSVSTDPNPSVICYNNPGTYDVTLIASDGISTDTLFIANYVSVYPYPPPQGINQSGDTLIANPGAVTYQWYYNGVLIPGATDYTYVAQASGSFNVVCTDVNGCEVEAVIFDVIAGLSASDEGRGFDVYPNPATGLLNIDFHTTGTKSISIYTMLGVMVAAREIQPSFVGKETLDVSGLPWGMYLLEVRSEKNTVRYQFTRQ